MDWCQEYDKFTAGVMNEFYDIPQTSQSQFYKGIKSQGNEGIIQM